MWNKVKFVKNPSAPKGYVNMGLDRILNRSQIIGLFDLDSVTVQKDSRQFIRFAQQNGEIEDATTDLPVTFLFCDGQGKKQNVLLTSFSLNTLHTHITRQFP